MNAFKTPRSITAATTLPPCFLCSTSNRQSGSFFKKHINLPRKKSHKTPPQWHLSHHHNVAILLFIQQRGNDGSGGALEMQHRHSLKVTDALNLEPSLCLWSSWQNSGNYCSI